MPLARKYQIPPQSAGFYHCISRCVRRAFLCGIDQYSGISYEHRRQWIVDRLIILTQSFAIDIYAYAVMSNHCHIVLYVDPARLDQCDSKELIARWRRIFKGAPANPSPEQLNEWKRCLCDVSWFMRCLNEPIARLANSEDRCKGHFWEKRFKSIALLDEPAVMACMAYVDLNPIRAGIAQTPRDSDYTSIKERIVTQPPILNTESTTDTFPTSHARPQKIGTCIQAIFGTSKERLSISQKQYIELVHWTANPNTIIQTNVLSLFDQMNIDQHHWIPTVNRFRRTFGTVAGSLQAVEEFIARTKRKRTRTPHALYLRSNE